MSQEVISSVESQEEKKPTIKFYSGIFTTLILIAFVICLINFIQIMSKGHDDGHQPATSEAPAH